MIFDGGRDLRHTTAHCFACGPGSLPQAASLTAPSSEGAFAHCTNDENLPMIETIGRFNCFTDTHLIAAGLLAAILSTCRPFDLWICKTIRKNTESPCVSTGCGVSSLLVSKRSKLLNTTHFHANLHTSTGKWCKSWCKLSCLETLLFQRFIAIRSNAFSTAS